MADMQGEATIREDERQACWEDVMHVLDQAISDKSKLRDVRNRIWQASWKDFGTGDGKAMHRMEKSYVNQRAALRSQGRDKETK